MEAIKTALDSKEAIGGQIYNEMLTQKLGILKRYSNEPSAKESIGAAEAILGRAKKELPPLLLEIEVKKLLQNLQLPLQRFEKALTSKDLDNIVARRKAALEYTVELKTKYNTHPTVQPLLQKVDKLVTESNSSLGNALAEKIYSHLSAKCKALLFWAKVAAGFHSLFSFSCFRTKR